MTSRGADAAPYRFNIAKGGSCSEPPEVLRYSLHLEITGCGSDVGCRPTADLPELK